MRALDLKQTGENGVMRALDLKQMGKVGLGENWI